MPKCNECSKEFQSRSSLHTHVDSIHKDEKYDCSKCCKLFKAKRYLLKHQNSVHGNKKYECSECNKEYQSKSITKRVFIGKKNMNVVNVESSLIQRHIYQSIWDQFKETT